MIDKFVKVENILSKESCDILSGAFLLMERDAPKTSFGDGQVDGAFFRHSYSGTESLLHYLKPKVEEIVGMSLLPTYSFARVYRKGHFLSKHVDRRECEVSLTITLKKDADWPIILDNAEVDLDQGDGALYQGMIVPHERKPYEGEEHVQVFLHYIIDNQ